MKGDSPTSSYPATGAPRCAVAAFILLLTVVAPALAVDGVREINQACALSGGCSAGDAPGFPVEITTDGSYRLTGNLAVGSGNGNVTAISISGFSPRPPAELEDGE